MRWDESHQSPDVIDRRGERRPVGGPGLGGVFTLFSMFGWKGAVVGLLLMGGLYLFQGRSTSPSHNAAAPQASATENRRVHFVGFVLDDVQSTWGRIFSQRGQSYRRTQLVVFRDATRSGCGIGEAAMGPFYCPNDQRVYIDLGFYDELAREFGAPGDFAQAYVIAHEVGHHVQHLLGIDAAVRAQAERDPSQRNALSVRQELQADCFAGVWARSTSQRQLLEPDDMAEAIRAASAIGDDRIQSQSGRGVNPETWTHGSSEQRMTWLRRGYDSGDMSACDTVPVPGGEERSAGTF
ncbi:MAG: neutral zinc metallopeptidase [Polyangiales bacterium]